MFCTSLRGRKQWAPAVPHLLQHDKMKFRESKLDTHDVNLPLPSAQPGQRYLRFCLLSIGDGDLTYKLQRIERLYHLSGGGDAVVVWLLGDGGDASPFMQFQVELSDKFDIPLVPLQKTQDLPGTLLRFHRSFLQADASTRQTTEQNRGNGAEHSLLPYCVLSPPLGEHSAHVLSDLTASLASLVNKIASEEGRAEVVDYVGQKDADRVLQFWVQEYLL